MAIDLVKELTDLRRQVLSMGGLVEQQLQRSLRSLHEADENLAKQVRSEDEQVNELEVTIEAHCLRILALARPVAGDLRFVLAVQRITNELERIGDLSKGIAKRAIYLCQGPTVEFPEVLVEMGRRCMAMLQEVVSALADERPEVLEHMHREDRFVDGMETEIFWWVQSTAPESPERTTAAVDILSIARRMERIADHCVNIAEDINFSVSGRIVRHGMDAGAETKE
ncbi:MAG: phosphate signaling complex protein PhoU [Phycisphaerales bacterium]|nr:phosphate signaling complex protein PhoU [Phycisphaerales bacterium]